MQLCFFFPGPPNFGLSRQYMHSPQSSVRHPVHFLQRVPLFIPLLVILRSTGVRSSEPWLCLVLFFLVTLSGAESLASFAGWLRLLLPRTTGGGSSLSFSSSAPESLDSLELSAFELSFGDESMSCGTVGSISCRDTVGEGTSLSSFTRSPSLRGKRSRSLVLIFSIIQSPIQTEKRELIYLCNNYFDIISSKGPPDESG